METLVLDIKSLRVYDAPRPVLGADNQPIAGRKAHVGALNLVDSFDEDNDKANTIRLTEAQMNDLASLARIAGKGRSAWEQLAVIVDPFIDGNGKLVCGKAILTTEVMKAGSTFIDTDGVEKVRKGGANGTDWTQAHVDRLVPTPKYSDALISVVAENSKKNWNTKLILSTFGAERSVETPVTVN